MSVFDPDAFMSESIKGEIDTRIIPVPEGEWNAQVDNLKFRQLDEGRVIMDVYWEILEESVKESTKLDKPTCRQSVFLDMTSEGSLDLSKGKNRRLGLLRAAVGQNTGKPWAPSMLIGQLAKVRVEHSPNPDDLENPYANVKAVTKS